MENMASESSSNGSPQLDFFQDPDLPPPSLSPGPMSQSNGNASKQIRPPRKSTLTQQQKNQKRQRATQEQLNTLEVEFNKNPTPTAMNRERIAQDINMTERSVQIWFQNRRAKIKNLAKKSIETGEDCDAIPESMRKYLAMQAMESGKPLVRDLTNRNVGAFGSGLVMNTESQAKVLISHLQCRSLTIGTWRRISQTSLDLVVFYSPAKAMMTYYINAESSGFKIEYPFSSITNITLDAGDASANAEGATQPSGGLTVELNRAPVFSMESKSGGFQVCRDFTEDQQASNVLSHHLGGHTKILSSQLAKFVALDAYRNRHVPAEANVTVSAPVSPVGARPASQPSQVIRPRIAFPDQPQGAGDFNDTSHSMAPPPVRVGHKRQRSRSVPLAVDFNQLRRPLPPFLQHDMPHPMHHQHHQLHQHIYAPIPQHSTMPVQQGFQSPQPLPNRPNSSFAPVGSNLNINTASANFDFEFRPGPMSATTANSSEVDHGYFTGGASSDTYTTSNMHTPYAQNFYSPMINPSNLSNPPMSPYTSIGHADPVIANQSPPMTSYDMRGQSAGIFNGNDEQCNFNNDNFNFNDLYTKQQPMTLPFRSPLAETSTLPNPEPDFDFQSMVHFDGNGSSSSPEAATRFQNGN